MDASYIALAINVVLILFVLFGLLWGLARGFKKSLVRLAYLLVFVIILGLLSPVISNLLLGITLPQSFVSGFASGAEIPAEGISITGLLELLLLGTSEAPTELGQLCVDNPALTELITKLPAVLVNLFVFVILVFAAKAMSWIGYFITCKIHFRKDKKKPKQVEYPEKQYAVVGGKPVIIEQTEQPKVKKHRLLGGLVGAVQGLVLMFCFFLPVTGFVNIAGQFIDTTSVQAETAYADSNNEYEYLQKYITQNIDPEIIEYFAAYKNSIANKALSLGGIDQVCFDMISSTKVEGEKISIRQEINTFAKVTESVLYVQDVTSNENFQFSDLDFDKLENAISTLFDSGLLHSVGDQFLMTYLGYAISTDEPVNDFDKTIDDAIDSTGYGDTIRRLLTAIHGNIESGHAIDTIKKDMLALFGVGQAVLASGLVDEIVALEQDRANSLISEAEYQERLITSIISSLKATPQGGEYNYLTMALDSFFSSSTLQALIAEGINIGIDEIKKEIVDNICQYDTAYNAASAQNVKDQIRQQIANGIVFDTVTPTSINFENFAITLGEIFGEMINIYEFAEEYKDVNFKNNAQVKTLITSTDYKNAVNSIGKVIDSFLNLEIFSGTVENSNLLNQLLVNYNKIYIKDQNDQAKQLAYFLDMTEFGVKNEQGKFNFGERISTVLYDMSQLMIEPLSVENFEDFDVSTFNYFGKDVGGKHIKGFVEVYDELLQLPEMQALSTNIIDVILHEINEEQLLDNPLITDIKNIFVIPNQNQSFADVRSEFTNLVSFMSVLGECGLFNTMTMAYSESSQNGGDDPQEPEEPVTAEIINDIVNKLTSTKEGETETQAERAISFLFEGKLAKQLMISAVNYYLFPELTDVEDASNGLTLSYTGFDILEADAKIIVNSILQIWQNLAIADNTELDTVFSTPINKTFMPYLLNQNFATAQTGTAASLGKIIDKILNSPLFTYDKTPEITTDNEFANVLKEAMQDFAGEGFYVYLDDALSPTAPANFWEVELSNIAPALKILNDIEYNEDLTVLLALFSDERPEDVLNAIPENQLDLVMDTLLTSSLLKNFAVNIINSANSTLIELIDSEAQITDACTSETNLMAQKDSIKAVLKSAIACKDIEDIETALKGEDKEKVKTLLSALEANANYATGMEGVFYTAYNDYYKPYKILIDGLETESFSTTQTLLDAVLAGENITEKALYMNQAKLQNIIGALIDCKLLKAYTIKVFNDINIKLINIINEEYNQEVCDDITDFKAQKDSLLAVVEKAQNCKDITSIENLTSVQQQAIQDLISALKANVQAFHSDGVFQVAYTEYFIEYENIL